MQFLAKNKKLLELATLIDDIRNPFLLGKLRN